VEEVKNPLIVLLEEKKMENSDKKGGLPMSMKPKS
jgi:hypothetical protein